MILAEVLRYLRILLFPAFFIRKSRRNTAKNVVITMTTLPSRIRNIRTTIASLLDQSIAPEKIILNLPKYSRREQIGYAIPRYLKNHPSILVNEIEEDLGPATKLLPTLKLFEGSDTLIIVADDDEIYPKGLIENYLSHADRFPTSVMSLVGWDAPEDFKHTSKQVLYGAIGDRPKGSMKVIKPTRTDCVQGASTFAVRPGFFTESIFLYADAPKEAFYVDDIWVSGHLAKNQVPVYIIPAPFRFARMKVLTHLVLSETLHKKENRSGENNNVLYGFFKKDWTSVKK